MIERASERACEDTIIAAARLGGWRVHATRPARTAKGWRTPIRGDAGFPDLVLACGPTLHFVELKRKPNKVEPAQRAWLDALGAAGAAASVVWVPEGLDDFVTYLTSRAEVVHQ
jgi:hypothetical protein